MSKVEIARLNMQLLGLNQCCDRLLYVLIDDKYQTITAKYNQTLTQF